MYKESFTSEMLSAIQPIDVLHDATCVEVDDFDAAFRQAADVADKEGKHDEALAWRLYAALCSFHFRPENKQEPFSNRLGFAEGRRTLIGSDFDARDIGELYSALPNIAPLALKVRVADLIWTQDKSKPDCARIAIDGYVELATRVRDGVGTLRFERELKSTSLPVQDFLCRSLTIARSIGWERPENDKLKTFFLVVLDDAISSDFMSLVRFANLGLDFGVSGVLDRIATTASKVEEAVAEADFHAAINLQNLIIRAYKIEHRDGDLAPLALKLASINEQQADAASNSFIKSNSLQLAIDALHGVRGVKEERQRLHEKLRESQVHASDGMTTISHSIDITDEIDRLLAGYDGLDLLDCLRRLALTEMPKHPQDLETAAKAELERYPLSSLFPAAILDVKGRTVARVGGGLENTETLRYKILQHQNTAFGLAVHAAIVPARVRITDRFDVKEEIIAKLCQLSPFVPQGWCNQVGRGLHAFLYGDEMVATAILVPFLEAGLREIVVAAGRVDTSIALDGIEQTIGLGKLLGEHRGLLESILGSHNVYAIENLFIHELGPKVRHSFCHGLSYDSTYYSSSYIYACKLIFSLVLLPLLAEDRWAGVKAYVMQ